MSAAVRRDDEWAIGSGGFHTHCVMPGQRRWCSMTTWSETARVKSAFLSIALLAVLGVDLIALVAVAAVVFGRRRWFKRQPGEFGGAVRD